MDDGWVTIDSKKKKNMHKKNGKKKKKSTSTPPFERETERKDMLDIDEPPVLNDVFKTTRSPEPREEPQYTVVRSRRKRKKGKSISPPEEIVKKEVVETPPEEIIQEKTKEEIFKEKDAIRARNALKKGDRLIYFCDFHEQYYEAAIVDMSGNLLTITYEESQKVVARNDPSVEPIWSNKAKCFLPAPIKEKKKKKASPETQSKKEKRKKQKKKGPKKLQMDEGPILKQISAIIQSYGNNDKMGLPEIMNYLREHLQDGSWKPKYKKKFGGMKKFLMKHPDRFEVVDRNGDIEITRLIPPPPKVIRDPSLRDENKPKTPRGNQSGGCITFMLIFCFIALSSSMCIFFMVNPESEFFKKIQGRLTELLSQTKKDL